MNTQQRQPTSYVSISSEQPFSDPRASDSTAQATQYAGISEKLDKAFDQLDGRLKRTFVSKHSSQNVATLRVMQKLTDWLISVCWNYSIDESGLFLATTLMTNYLKYRSVDKKQLQAVAMTSLLIATKYTQVKKLSLRDAVDFCSGLYTKEEIADLEGEVLLLHECNLEVASSLRYMDEWLWEGSLTQQQQNEVAFWLEVDLLMHGGGMSAREIFSEVLSFVLHRHSHDKSSMEAKSTKTDYIMRLIRFARDPPYKTIVQKYMSKFDTDSYLKECCPEWKKCQSAIT